MPPSGLDAHICPCDHFSSRVPPSVVTPFQWYRNINLSSIGYAFRPRLRVRLTLGGFTVPRNPWVCGEQDSHLLSRYLFRHNRFQSVQVSLPSPFTRLERSPTNAKSHDPLQSAASVVRLSPVHFRRRTSRPVSYYALFK
jgi:hypothetical protein